MVKAAKQAGEIKEGEEMSPEMSQKAAEHMLQVRRERDREL